MRRGVIYKYTCLITNKIYIGQTICEYNRRQVGQISRCCSGKAKSAYGFIWTYY